MSISVHDVNQSLRPRVFLSRIQQPHTGIQTLMDPQAEHLYTIKLVQALLIFEVLQEPGVLQSGGIEIIQVWF